MKHNSDVPGQLTLLTVAPTSEIRLAIHDPYWDEILAPQQVEDRWNPADFGEVPFKSDDGQLTIFYDDSQEPPDPDDYQTLNDYYQACSEWELRVGGQVSKATLQHTAESLVGGQVRLDTKKVAPQHDAHWVEKYWVERSSNKYWYFRYCWMTGRKINRIYLGSVDSIKAKKVKQAVEIAIANGKLPFQLKHLIKGWKKASVQQPFWRIPQ